ncbi:hypothetical protein PYW08_011639 [Mythimna loreyi]|uniref:Uncharacterized protein n=1 Tax=Mythimna loreyi TaxID=667449 RepID=A0ACC2QK11_9NEOP|nr:hypothetical protein PYW08_011639 [Mythimna loreyi]
MDYEIEGLSYLEDTSQSLLNTLPDVDSFFGTLDLKTGSFIIAALCLFHPTIYGCTFFMPMSYLLLTIWLLQVLFFTTSILLFYGLTNNDVPLISAWIWYSMLFVAAMFILMFLLGLFFISKKERVKTFIVFIGILWYILTIYFILVVNSHRRILVDAALITKTELSESTQSPKTTKSSKHSEKLVKDHLKADQKLGPGPEQEQGPESNDNIDASYKEDEKENEKDQLKAFRKVDQVTMSQVWFRQMAETESAVKGDLPEFDCSAMAPGVQNIKAHDLTKRL